MRLVRYATEGSEQESEELTRVREESKKLTRAYKEGMYDAQMRRYCIKQRRPKEGILGLLSLFYKKALQMVCCAHGGLVMKVSKG